MEKQFAGGAMKESAGVYIVIYRWWRVWEESVSEDKRTAPSKDSTLYRLKLCEETSSMPNNLISIDDSDLSFDLIAEQSSPVPELQETVLDGRCYVLLPEDVWRRIHQWYSEQASTNNGSILASSSHKDMMRDVYTLRLQLNASSEGSQITVRISKKANEGEYYNRACELFNVGSEQVHIWDFFGQTKFALINNQNKTIQGSENQLDQDTLLELQVDGILPHSTISNTRPLYSNGSVGNHLAIVPVESSRQEPSLAGGSVLTKSISRSSSPELSISHSLSSQYGSLDGIGSSGSRAGPVGLIGLNNLGNTCFMNSALQCLVHTPRLVDYFLGNYTKEINRQNPLGMEGELANAFGELLRKLWAPGRTPVSPRLFKSKLARFAPQFSGYNQHDSQELLAFLLDGLHEDLNRVKHKPYIESKDADGRPDEEVAEEHWGNHLARNDSIIVDLCQGQFKSTLVCPECSKVSVTFDPFMHLSLPLPSTTTRTMTVTVFSTEGVAPPAPYTVTVPKQGRCKDLVQAVSNACSLRNHEILMVTEIHSHREVHYLKPLDSLSLIRDDQHLAAYRLPKDQEEAPLIEFIHHRKEDSQSTGYWKPFGTPLITSLLDHARTAADIRALFLTLLAPMSRMKSVTEKENGYKTGASDDVQMEEFSDQPSLSNGTLDDEFESLLNDVGNTLPNGHTSCTSSSELSFRFWLTDEKGIKKEVSLEANEPISLGKTSRRLQILVNWSEQMLEKYDTHQLDMLPEVFKFGFSTKRVSQDSISLCACLEAFLNEEPLGPDDMWYCPRCKEHRQASKKLDLWRLPEILVVHLKRFSYSRFLKNKLDTFVNFPIHDLDLTRYVYHKSGSQSNIYELYAVSNHYGSMGGGHYTAYAKLIEENRWYNFDDSHVSSVSEDRIKSSAAYVLFYRRVKPEDAIANNGGIL
ncbi:ubiquitin carboxyl-terminal hydrolase 5 isoform X2 [Cryptomeria japonica]|uniref:ubiquitin carboxyl-terminal hydrolase 5 isoform X2 n=1 Tax=Cryptomeria japonica TaxID=3369 RepID=UPI0027DA96B4|nr:ubiquitin carboxyl-terminal hydrolase 5 isoform X2 [Cryptomeria japonica]